MVVAAAATDENEDNISFWSVIIVSFLSRKERMRKAPPAYILSRSYGLILYACISEVYKYPIYDM